MKQHRFFCLHIYLLRVEGGNELTEALSQESSKGIINHRSVCQGYTQLISLQLTHPTIWGGLLYLGVVSTAVAFLLWNRGLQMLNASSGGIFFFFQPVVGTLLGWLILGENIGVTF